MHLSSKQKLSLFENLHTMLSAGIPIVESFDSIKEDMPAGHKKLMSDIQKSLTEGVSLSTALSKPKGLFDPITVNLLNSGEKSGNLVEVLEEIVIHIKREIDFSSKVKTALLYPLLVFILFIGIMVVIMTYVIPRISEVFGKLKVDIPVPTQILITASEFFNEYWIWILVATVLLIVGLVLLARFKKRFLMNMLSSMPFVSGLFLKIDISRLFRSMHVLLSSGITIDDSVEYSAQVVSNKKLIKVLKSSKNVLLEGKSLSEGLKQDHKLFGNLTLRMLQAGEISGTLENSVKRISEDYDKKVEESLKMITTILEPVMLITIAVFVGGIMLAIIAPIYQMIGNISQR